MKHLAIPLILLCCLTDYASACDYGVPASAPLFAPSCASASCASAAPVYTTQRQVFRTVVRAPSYAPSDCGGDVGVPAFAPRAFAPSYGVSAAFVPSYGVGRAFAPGYGVGRSVFVRGRGFGVTPAFGLGVGVPGFGLNVGFGFRSPFFAPRVFAPRVGFGFGVSRGIFRGPVIGPRIGVGRVIRRAPVGRGAVAPRAIIRRR